MAVHKCLPDILTRNNALLLIGEVLVAGGKQVEDFFYLGFFFAGDVVLLGEFGLACFRSFGGCGCCCRGRTSAFLGRLECGISLCRLCGVLLKRRQDTNIPCVTSVGRMRPKG